MSSAKCVGKETRIKDHCTFVVQVISLIDLAIFFSHTGVPEVQLCQNHNEYFHTVIHSITAKTNNIVLHITNYKID